MNTIVLAERITAINGANQSAHLLPQKCSNMLVDVHDLERDLEVIRGVIPGKEIESLIERVRDVRRALNRCELSALEIDVDRASARAYKRLNREAEEAA